MQFTTRRVVTGHRADGKAVVLKDDVMTSDERWPDMHLIYAWATGAWPVSNDEGRELQGVEGHAGDRVVLRIANFTSPGIMHRTQSLDFAVVLAGRCDMELDSGEVVKDLNVGDIVIQRGTNHAWVNPGEEPVKMLFVLVDAEPVTTEAGVLGNFFENLKSLDPQYHKRVDIHRAQVISDS